MGCDFSRETYGPGVISFYAKDPNARMELYLDHEDVIRFECEDPNDVLYFDDVLVPNGESHEYTCNSSEDYILVDLNLRCAPAATPPQQCNIDFATLASKGVLAYQASTSIDANYLESFDITQGMYSVEDGETIVFSCIQPGQDLLKDGKTLLPGHIDLDFYPYVCDPTDAAQGTFDFECVDEQG